MTAVLQVHPIQLVGINRFLLPTAIIFAVAGIVRREKEIGGWLLYFYYWILAIPVTSAIHVARHQSVFFSSANQKPLYHLALILAVFPRLLAFGVSAVLALVLLFRRDWEWVERLRLSLAVAAIVALLSIGLDAKYFPGSLYFNFLRWVGAFLWTLYFYRSRRVRRVFQTHDWHNNSIG